MYTYYYLRDSIREYEKSQTTDNTSNSILTSNSGLWCSLPNIEGYSCPPDSCWLDGDQDECLGYDGNMYLPQIIEEAEIDDCDDINCGGGGFPTWPPPPDDPDDPWNPPPDNGGGGVCTSCEPGDDPNDNDDEELCALGDDGCEEEDLFKPCEGNPVKDPRIASQANSEIEGGRFGFARTNPDGSPKEHSALDIKVNFGEPIYSLFNGTIINTGYQGDGWGNWILIKSDIGGIDYYLLYAHLNNINQTSGDILAGAILGTAGDSGNLKEAIEDELAVMHLHLETRLVSTGVTYNNSEKVNPEDILTTKFNSTGEPLPETDC